jgi:hypothetical protein
MSQFDYEFNYKKVLLFVLIPVVMSDHPFSNHRAPSTPNFALALCS